ncbi:MAG: hypothetical protein SGPRY_011100, partial [Prymnesium sp.]
RVADTVLAMEWDLDLSPDLTDDKIFVFFIAYLHWRCEGGGEHANHGMRCARRGIGHGDLICDTEALQEIVGCVEIEFHVAHKDERANFILRAQGHHLGVGRRARALDSLLTRLVAER